MIKVLAVAVVLLLAALGWQWGRAEHAGRKADQYQGERDAAVKAHRDEAAARLTESRRTVRLQENQDAEFILRQAAQRDAAAARAAVVSLRGAAYSAAATSCAASHPSATPGSTPAANGPNLLADVLGEIAEHADRLAVAADGARIAGQLCVAAYEGLRLP